MSERRWKCEARAVIGFAEEQWWLTDGQEGFRMASKFTAEMLASYLNESSSALLRSRDEPLDGREDV